MGEGNLGDKETLANERANNKYGKRREGIIEDIDLIIICHGLIEILKYKYSNIVMKTYIFKWQCDLANHS